MREKKPYWRQVPQFLQDQVGALVGSPVKRAVRVFGGYGPSATFRATLADGRRVFIKGAGIGATEHHWTVLPREQRHYETLPALHRIGPRYWGAVTAPGWHLLVLEDLTGTTIVPPWTRTLAQSAMENVAHFHLDGLRESVPVRPFPTEGFTSNWARLAADATLASNFLSLFRSHQRQTAAWLHRALPRLVAAEQYLVRQDQPWGLIHMDLRSDNLRFRQGTLVLFDWADACYGPLLFDVAGFLPSIEAEGGPRAPELASVYLNTMRKGGIVFPDYGLGAAATGVAGYFATRAGEPPIPALPRLRAVQRAQLSRALPWASTLLGLDSPPEFLGSENLLH